MSRFFILFVITLLFAVFATFGNAANAPPIKVTTTHFVLEGDDPSSDDSYVSKTYSLYPEASTVEQVPAFYKTAKVKIENVGSESIQIVLVLSAGVVYSDDLDNRATLLALPKTLTITDEANPDSEPPFTLAPSEYKELTLNYSGCSAKFDVGAVISIQAVSVQTSTLYDPVDVLMDLECTEEVCGSDCTKHGRCIKDIGVCVCEDGWNGVECNYRGNFTEEMCPGESIEVFMSFSTTQCDAYFAIYHVDNLYQSAVYMDFPRDNCALNDPWPADGSIYHTNLTAYLTPGDYFIGLTQQYGKTQAAIFDLHVKSWSECGNNYDCSEHEEADQCTGQGTCESDGNCTCHPGYFWNDCSGGCAENTILTDKTGIINSDPLAEEYHRYSMYTENAFCQWIISPPDVDIIDLEFVSFDLDGGSDFLSIRRVDKDGKVNTTAEPLYKMTGKKYPQTLSIPYGRVALILESDYTVSSAGFKIKYTSRNAPLEGKYIAAISVCGVFLIVLIVFLIAFFSVRNKKKREEELAAAVKATSIPWVLSEQEEQVETTAKEKVRVARLKLNDLYGADDAEDSGDDESDEETNMLDERSESTVDHESSHESKEQPSAGEKKSEESSDGEKEKKEKRREAGLDREAIVKSMSETDEELGWLDLGCLGIECDQHWPRFGLEQGATCPIMEDLKTKINLVNSSDSPISFCFFHPVDEEKFSLSLCPGRGTIPPDTSVTITMNFRLFYTTFVFDHVKLAIYKANKVRDDFEGFDPYIDEEEQELKTPIATARLGISLEGSVSERIDPYEITLRPGTLGVGAFGTVYTGKYRQRIVAVKVMTRQADMMAQIKEEFEKEIELYRKLRSPLLVDFIGASLIPGKLCVATELIRHGSLENMMSAGEIPFVLQTRFAHNIAEAVSYLHSNNVLYRDLKPSNVMIVSFSLNAKINCKIGDFGTARNVADVEEFFLYTAGQGTPIYMAPEVLANKEYNSRADVYSYAVTLWQMLSRQRPWDNVPVWEFPQRVINGARPPLPEKESLDAMGVTDDYIRLIKSCWDADARKRPAFTAILSTLGPICKQAKQAFKESGQHINPRIYPVVGETGALLIGTEAAEEEGEGRSHSLSLSEAAESVRGGDAASQGKVPVALRKQASSNYISTASSSTTSKGSYEGKRQKIGFTLTLADAMSASVPSQTRGDSSMNSANPASMNAAVRSSKASTLSKKK